MMIIEKYFRATSCDHLWSGHVFAMMFLFHYLVSSNVAFPLTTWIYHFLELGAISCGGLNGVMESQLLTHPSHNSLYYIIGAQYVL